MGCNGGRCVVKRQHERLAGPEAGAPGMGGAYAPRMCRRAPRQMDTQAPTPVASTREGALEPG